MGLDTCTREPSGGPALDAQDGEEVVSGGLGVSLFCDSQQGEKGQLFVTNRRVVWLSDADAAKGFSIPFRSMSMHALSRDTEAFPHHCIYAQVDVPRGPDDAPEDEGEEEDGDGFEGDEETIEIRFVPDDPASVDSLYQTFCQCALLNPDPVSEDEDDELFFDENEVRAGADDRAEALEDRFEAMLQMDAGRFADDDDDEGEEEEEDEEYEEAEANGGAVTMK